MIRTLIKYVIVITALCLTVTAFAEDAPIANSPSPDPAPVTAEPADQVSVKPEPSKPMSDVDLLKEQINRLEGKLTKMEEENDIRRRLETTEEEKSTTDEAILSAAGRDYTLMKPGKLGFEYSFRYNGSTFDSFDTTSSPMALAHNASHTVTNSFLVEFPVKDNLTINSSIPFVYKMSSKTSSKVKDVSDLGDVSFGFQHQPIKSGADMPSLILSGSLNCPTGRSPYKIDNTTEMSTGNGVYSISLGCNLSKSIDPLVAFGGINVDHGFETTHLNFKSGTLGESGVYLAGVKPGDTYSLSMGIGYSLSYKSSLTLSYQYSYQAKTALDYVGMDDRKTEGTISSVFSVGTGWNISPKRSVNIRLGIGLTNNDSDFSLMVRVPLTYEL